MEHDVIIKNLTISELHRRECMVPVETFYVGENARIDNLKIRDVTMENFTEQPISLFVNHGHIKRMYMTDIHADGNDEIVNEGRIDQLIR